MAAGIAWQVHAIHQAVYRHNKSLSAIVIVMDQVMLASD